ncbi:MAG: hypothetical protein JXO49_12020 [Deltaproteobacteria bacterium]|nr:hypothetical protein [Candidatus Anaeroferrophillus wilburensis]MBN2890060.1 hypothetical protein [Deltaproteobacteria bacterium]
MITWYQAHSALFWWLTLASAISFVGTLIIVPALLVRMPADYFARHRPYYRGHHPVVHWAILIGKNLFGITFLLAGLVMLFVPGQGILTILIGITLLNFPGKRRLEQRFIRLPKVHLAINHLRQRAGRPPLLSLLSENHTDNGKTSSNL